jgi:AAA+ superfamily predicted ATPase
LTTKAPSIGFAAVADRVRAAVADVAASDPHPSDPYRGLYLTDELALTLGAERPALDLEQRFDDACSRLELDALDRAALALCAAPEIQPDFGRMFGYLHDDLTRREASPRLVARLLTGPGVSAADVLVCFDRAGRLTRTGAVRLQGDGPLADRAATIGPQLANHLLGTRLIDASGDWALRRLEPPAISLGRSDHVSRIASLLTRDSRLPLAVVGPDARLAIAAAAQRGIVILDARTATVHAAWADLALTAALESRVAVIDGIQGIPTDGATAILERISALPCRPVLCIEDRRDALALADLAAFVIELPPLSLAEREHAWRGATGVRAVDDVAARYRLDATRIIEAAELARADAASTGRRNPAASQLSAAARAASSRRIGELAQRLEPGPGWDDMILPERQVAALHALSSFLRNRERVLGGWGYDAIAGQRGLTALFAGESGTGKTLAARVIARAAELDVYRVDLSGLFSKWVGETEKNLERVFHAAEAANAVLFFDEADVVFGKRTEASDSSDRYANLETAFLLQRIEVYDGVVVLATNLRSNMDDAFVRRLDLVVDFPPPDLPTRKRLWRALLPSSAPFAEDVDIDFLARRFELSGGGIRNCSVAAALLAADEGGEIRMAHLIRAVAMEYAKLGRLTVQADFGQFHPLVVNGAAGPV